MFAPETAHMVVTALNTLDRPARSTVRLAGRLDRIAKAHSRGVLGHGGYTCDECHRHWPCPTYLWATTERDPVMSAWRPGDDTTGGTA